MNAVYTIACPTEHLLYQCSYLRAEPEQLRQYVSDCSRHHMLKLVCRLHREKSYRSGNAVSTLKISWLSSQEYCMLDPFVLLSIRYKTAGIHPPSRLLYHNCRLLYSQVAKSMQPCAGKYHHIYSLSDLMVSLSQLECCWMISCLVQEGSSSGNIKVPESCSLQSLILVELLARFLSPSQLTSLLEPVS